MAKDPRDQVGQKEMNPAIEWLEAEFDKVEFEDITDAFFRGQADGLRFTGRVYDPHTVTTRPMFEIKDASRQSDLYHANDCTICNDPAELYARFRGNR